MRPLPILALAIGLASAPVVAETPGQALLLNGRLGWVFPGASPDLNFATGQYFGLQPSQLTVSRASTESEVCGGRLYTFTPNAPAITPGCGLWVWEARTNSIRNNTMAGASAGVAPTFWANNTPSSGITVVTGAPIVSNGFTWLPLTFTGTASATAQQNALSLDGTVNIPALYGQTWAYSIAAYSTGVVPTIRLDFAERTAAGAGVIDAVSGIFTTTPQITTFSLNYTVTSPTAGNALPRIYLNLTNGNTYSGTLYIAVPQLEQNPNLPASVASAVKASDGTGGVNGSGVYTVTGGTCATQPTINATWAAGVLTAGSVVAAGSCSALPPSPATLAYLSGAATGWTGATVTLTPVDNSAQGFATGPILTSAGAASRALSLVSFPQTSGVNTSIACAGSPAPPTVLATANESVCNWSDGTSNNQIGLLRAAASGAAFVSVRQGGSTSWSTSSSTWAANTTGKFAVANSTGAQNGAFNTSALSPSGTGASPSNLTTVKIGSDANGVATFNGAISRVTTFPNKTLSASQLGSVTQ